MDAVALAMQHDCPHRYRRLCFEAPLGRFEGRIACRVAEAMTVGLNDDVDEVRIVERRGAPLIGRVVEMPVRRPQLPEQPAQLAPIGSQPGPPTVAAEIILIPQSISVRQVAPAHLTGNVLKIVAATG